MSLAIDKTRLAALKEADTLESILLLACDGLRPQVIAQRLNLPKGRVDRIVTGDKFLEALKLRNPEAAETWDILVTEERVTNIRVAAQSHAVEALDTLVSLMQNSKVDTVRLRAAEDVLQITGTMSKAPQALELVELTPSAEKALTEARVAMLNRPPKMLQEKERDGSYVSETEEIA